MKEASVGHVLLVGGAGGGLSWLFTIAVGLPQIVSPWWAAAAIGIPLGAGAAFVGVYLLANSSPAPAARCLAFALLCGFSWRPVFEAGTAIVRQKTQIDEARGTAASLLARAVRIRADLDAATAPQPTQVAVREAGELAAQLVAASSATAVVDPSLAEKMQIEAANTLTSAAKHPSASNASSVAALPIDLTVEALAATRATVSPKTAERIQELDHALSSLKAVRPPN